MLFGVQSFGTIVLASRILVYPESIIASDIIHLSLSMSFSQTTLIFFLGIFSMSQMAVTRLVWAKHLPSFVSLRVVYCFYNTMITILDGLATDESNT